MERSAALEHDRLSDSGPLPHNDSASELVMPALLARIKCDPKDAKEQGKDGDKVAEVPDDELRCSSSATGFRVNAGTKNPLALIHEIRAWFDGPLALSGAIASGSAVLAAQAMGADLAYIGSAFIATEEARADEAYKRMIVECSSDDIVYSDLFTGVHGNYLKPSIRAAGLDPDDLPSSDPNAMNFGSTRKPWKDIWGCGQGIGAVRGVESVAARVDALEREYEEARGKLLSSRRVRSGAPDMA
jgi:NAD(P)H-dependent flavin oxidoreductase YrpB (nitropropane dioxygenase family)